MIIEEITIKDVKIKIAKLTRLMRKNRGISQEELSEALAVSRITIVNMERGNNITIDTLLKTFQYFDALDKLQLFIQQSINDNNVKSLY